MNTRRLIGTTLVARPSTGPRFLISFPRSAWECRLRRSASDFFSGGTQSVQECIPTRSVGTRLLATDHLLMPQNQPRQPATVGRLDVVGHRLAGGQVADGPVRLA